MKTREAVDLIRQGVGDARGQTWADFGAGEGTFTRALAELVGATGQVIAIDRDDAAIRALHRIREEVASPQIEVCKCDIAKLGEITKLHSGQLDGGLFANVLHFVEDPTAVLMELRRYLRADGRVLVVEYERRAPSMWVPFPISLNRLSDVAEKAGFSAPIETGRRRSRYQGELYCAVMRCRSHD